MTTARSILVAVTAACGAHAAEPGLECNVVVTTAFDRALAVLARGSDATHSAEAVPALKVAITRECEVSEWPRSVRACLRDTDGVSITPCEKGLSREQATRLDQVYASIIEPRQKQVQAEFIASLPKACAQLAQFGQSLLSCAGIRATHGAEILRDVEHYAKAAGERSALSALCEQELNVVGTGGCE